MSYHNTMFENQAMFTRMVYKRLEGEKLSKGQPKILEYLLQHNGIPQKDIAAACQIEPATVTSVLSGMENHDLIKRSAKSEDKRYSYVSLTPCGEKAAKSAVAAFEEIEKDALNGFDNSELEQLLSYLARINANLKGAQR